MAPGTLRLIKLAQDDKSPQDKIKSELEKYKKFLKNLDSNLKEKKLLVQSQDPDDDKEVFFSGTSDISLADIAVHSEVITVVNMYSANRELDPKEFPDLSKWLKDMEEASVTIKNSNDKMYEIIKEKRLQSNLLNELK